MVDEKRRRRRFALAASMLSGTSECGSHQIPFCVCKFRPYQLLNQPLAKRYLDSGGLRGTLKAHWTAFFAGSNTLRFTNIPPRPPRPLSPICPCPSKKYISWIMENTGLGVLTGWLVIFSQQGRGRRGIRCLTPSQYPSLSHRCDKRNQYALRRGEGIR